MNRRAMLINNHTYGYYYEDAKTFECTHGDWSSKIEIINENQCKLNALGGKASNYKFIDEIPEDYIR